MAFTDFNTNMSEEFEMNPSDNLTAGGRLTMFKNQYLKKKHMILVTFFS